MCLPLTCPQNEQFTPPDSCCPVCKGELTLSWDLSWALSVLKHPYLWCFFCVWHRLCDRGPGQTRRQRQQLDWQRRPLRHMYLQCKCHRRTRTARVLLQLIIIMITFTHHKTLIILKIIWGNIKDIIFNISVLKLDLTENVFTQRNIFFTKGKGVFHLVPCSFKEHLVMFLDL